MSTLTAPQTLLQARKSTHAIVIEPVDPRYGCIGKILMSLPIDSETWLCLRFSDGDEGAYQDNEVRPL